MNILIVNSMDIGGAASACIRMHNGLINFGINSNLLLKIKSKNVNKSFVCPKKALPIPSFRDKCLIKFRRIALELKLIKPPSMAVNEKSEFLNQRQEGLEFFSFTDSSYDITESELYREADLIHFHWVANFLNWESFFTKNTKPIIWTLHDQNPFLGGEHYAERFLGIDEYGKPKKRVYTQVEIDKENELLQIKSRNLNGLENMWIVSPSKWLLESSLQSKLFCDFPHSLIPNGIPDVFRPFDRNVCREILGLPQNKRIILFVADSVDNSRKGYAFLKKSLEKLDDEFVDNLVLCAIGHKTDLNQNNMFIELGKIHDERLMAIAYSAADLFVIPSLEDNLPNTMLESLCCGTPVLGFPTGGILDVIEDRVNGFLCNEISVKALNDGVRRFLSNEVIFDRAEISEAARNSFSIQKQALEYIRLYKEVLE